MSTLKIKLKIPFDVTNEEHLQLFKQYLVNSNWGIMCPFRLEYPWSNIPDMIKDKIARHYLNIKG